MPVYPFLTRIQRNQRHNTLLNIFLAPFLYQLQVMYTWIKSSMRIPLRDRSHTMEGRGFFFFFNIYPYTYWQMELVSHHSTLQPNNIWSLGYCIGDLNTGQTWPWGCLRVKLWYKLVPTIVTYVELRYIEHFSSNRCQHLKGLGRALWNVLVISNALKGFPSVPCGRGWFFNN